MLDIRSAALGILLFMGGWLAVEAVPAHAASSNSVTLEWTAPGDDQWIGSASGYDIRFSRQPITAANFTSSSRLTTLLLPAPAGTKQRFTLFGLTPGVVYHFAVKAVDEAGNWSSISNVVSHPGSTVDSETGVAVRSHFSVPWPNPARSHVRFTVSLPREEWLRIEAFDVVGRCVKTLALGEYSGGTFDLSWNLRDSEDRPVPVGTYLVRSQIGDQVFLRRLAIVH